MVSGHRHGGPPTDERCTSITLPVQDAGKFWAHAVPIVVSIFERLAYWNGSMNGQLTIWSAFMGRAMLTVSASSPL